MKTYSIRTNGQEHTVPIPANGKNKYIKFAKSNSISLLGYFVTSDTELQAQIEQSEAYKKGRIKLHFSDQEEQKVKPQPKAKEPQATKEITEYPEVTTFQQAKEVLSAAPWNVHKGSPLLRNPEGILRKAQDVGAAFPNLKKA